MRPHYDNVIRTLTECPTPICRCNPLFDPTDLDKDGVPNQPEVLYIPGEEYRVISFDEMKCDDKTHGDGGARKGALKGPSDAAPWTLENVLAANTQTTLPASSVAPLARGRRCLHSLSLRAQA